MLRKALVILLGSIWRFWSCDSACASLSKTKRRACFKLFWLRDGYSSVKYLSRCLFFCLLHCQLLLSFLPCLQERCVVSYTQRYTHTGASQSLAGTAAWPFTAWWKAVSARIVKHSKSFTFYEENRKKKVALFMCAYSQLNYLFNPVLNTTGILSVHIMGIMRFNSC